MNIFDFLFYSLAKFYSKKEKGAESSSAGIIGGLQAANTLSALMLGSWILSTDKLVTKPIFLTIAVFFQITSYIKYVHRNKLSTTQFERLEPEKKKRLKLISILYVVLSIATFFASVFFLNTSRS